MNPAGVISARALTETVLFLILIFFVGTISAYAVAGDIIDLPEIVVSGVAEAQCIEGFCPLADVSGSKLGTLYSGSDGDLSNFIGRLFGFALSIGAILAILRIAWGGYLYMTTDLWSSKERAREVLRETVLGLLLLLAVWVILSQINPDILKLQLGITAVPAASTAPAGSGGAGTTSALPPGGQWCIAGGGACAATETACDANRGFFSPRCFYFTP